jgi:hypothetical protein
LDIEKDQVRIVLADEVDAFEAVLALGHNLDVTYVFQQEGKFVAGKLFIVHDDCGQRHSFSWRAHSKYTSDFGHRASDLRPQTSDPSI